MWYVRTKKSPYIYVRFAHPDGSGKFVSISTRTESRKEAKERGPGIVQEFRRSWERGQAGGNLSARAVIASFWETEASRRKSGHSHILPHLERITQFLGDRPYADVTISDVAAFCDQLDGKVSDSTINRAVSVWRRLHNVAAKKREIPVRAIDWSQVRRDEPAPTSRHIATNVLRAILAALPDRSREIVAFALLTGARRSQVLGLTWDRVDVEGGTCTVWRKHRKAMAPQRIELHPAAVDILRGRPADGALVFDTTNFRRHWDAAVKQAGAPGVRFHDLRHTFATLLARRASLAVVGMQLGHSSPILTARYAHVQRQDVQTAIHQLPIADVLGKPED